MWPAMRCRYGHRAVAILLVAPPEELGVALIERLVAQDDEVRVVEDDASAAQRWKKLKAQVAPGSATDSDLLERAALNVRTVVMFRSRGHDADVLHAVIEAMGLAGVERIIAGTDEPELITGVLPGDFEHVILISPYFASRSHLLARALRREPSAERLAEAIDAADDLAGHPRLVLDLRDPTAWTLLGLP